MTLKSVRVSCCMFQVQLINMLRHVARKVTGGALQSSQGASVVASRLYHEKVCGFHRQDLHSYLMQNELESAFRQLTSNHGIFLCLEFVFVFGRLSKRDGYSCRSFLYFSILRWYLASLFWMRRNVFQVLTHQSLK